VGSSIRVYAVTDFFVAVHAAVVVRFFNGLDNKNCPFMWGDLELHRVP